MSGHLAKFLALPIPPRMRWLKKDHRGFPIPCNVLIDSDGRPHFTVTDAHKALQLFAERKCQICGTMLQHAADRFIWFVGGPKAAFHAHGAYFDGPMHHACATYALQVCPWLAAPVYSKRIDDATVDPSKVEGMLITDTTQLSDGEIADDPERPKLYVLTATTEAMVHPEHRIHIAKRPWSRIEYWQHGSKIEPAAAVEIMTSTLAPEFLEHMPAGGQP